MKLFSKLLFASILFFSVISSCKKPAIRYITKGTWAVSLYTDKGKDETADFANYTFEFQSDNTLKATRPTGEIVNGTWNYVDASSKYIFNISGTDKLDKISGTWFIIDKASDLIQLTDDNSSKNEMLNFKKK